MRHTIDVAICYEASGILREAFRRRGYNAVSIDIKPSEQAGPHLQMDIKRFDFRKARLAICHPPCTHTAVSGAHAFKHKQRQQADALANIWWLWSRPIFHLAIEQPVSIVSRILGKPQNIVQPWYFGSDESKRTCFWTRFLPKLEPTRIVLPRSESCWLERPGPERQTNRSRIDPWLADAIAEQWSAVL